MSPTEQEEHKRAIDDKNAELTRFRADVARLARERDELQRRLDRVVMYADGVVVMFDLPDTRYRWREQREAMDKLRAALAPEQEAQHGE